MYITQKNNSETKGSNDTAERGIFLILSFNSVLSKREDKKQYLM